MSIDFSLDFKGEYIHIMHPPDYEITPESQGKLWTELSLACKKYNCVKVLTEGSSHKREMGSMDVFYSGVQVSKAIPGLVLAICIYEYVPDKMTTFFMNVAHNRGAYIEYFQDKRKALEWLGIKDAEPQP
ncbi:MAG: hypothetical protein ABSC11_00300 [Smithella sp.]|jgi:hypothetical protein